MPAETASPALFLSLRSFCRRPPAFAAPASTVADAARRMRDEGVGSLLLAGPPLGIVTDRDLRNRVLAEGRDPESAAEAVATRPVLVLGEDATVLDALLLMVEQRIRHVPVIGNGDVVGVVSATDLMVAQASDPLSLLRRVEQGLPGTGTFAAELRGMVGHLGEAGLEALQIGRLVASLADALLRRILARMESELGPAPLPYAFLVYGSEGRREQILPTDQDNALIWADPAPGQEAAVRRYFEALAGKVVAELVAQGIPECPGGYMATRWAFPLAEAESLLRSYLEQPRAETVLDACSLFDFRIAAGQLDCGTLAALRLEAAGAKHFQRLLAADAAGWRLPFGWLGGLREGDRGFDLKRGILLIVSVARLFALAAGSPAVGTIERLQAAAPTLGEGDAATLAEAFRFLVEMRLEEQLHGRTQDSRVHLAALNAMQRRFLKDVFGFLGRLQETLPQRFAL